MAKIIIYSKAGCPFCDMAKELLSRKGATYTEVRIDLDEGERAKMLEKSGGRRTVPQIFINDQLIGGFDDLSELNRQGKLDPLLTE